MLLIDNFLSHEDTRLRTAYLKSAVRNTRLDALRDNFKNEKYTIDTT